MLKNGSYLVLALILAGCAGEGTQESAPPVAAADAADAATHTAETRLALRTDPRVELYFSVRALAADPDAEVPAGYEAAVQAARALQQSLGSFGGWGALESRLFDATSAAELRQGFEELPEPYSSRGKELSIRGDALRLAAALETLAPGFEAEVWPTRRAQIERQIANLEQTFLPKHREALAFMMESLGIADPEIEVPVYFVSRANPPGAMTYRLYGGRPVCLVDVVSGAQGDQLIELILHESSHTLDAASRGDDDAFSILRSLLEEKGVDRGAYLYQVVPHTLMFLQAEEATRRFYNPDHVAYGDSYGVYERIGPIAALERREWYRYLAGEQTREEALRAIVAVLDVNKPRDDEAGS
jgi:hypothetical protein